MPAPGYDIDDESFVMTDNSAARTRSQRLDALPWTRKHSRILGGSGVGWRAAKLQAGVESDSAARTSHKRFTMVRITF